MNERLLRLFIAEIRQNVERLGCADCSYCDLEDTPPPWRLNDKDARDSIASALAMMEYEIDTPKKP